MLARCKRLYKKFVIFEDICSDAKKNDPESIEYDNEVITSLFDRTFIRVYRLAYKKRKPTNDAF